MRGRGAAVIRYEGKRGVVWRIKYLDAQGEQVQETLGHERDGWTERKAEAELRQRLVDVEREGLRKPTRETFADFAAEWLTVIPTTRTLKRSTVEGYEAIIRLHLNPAFGHMTLGAIDSGRIQRWVAETMAEGAEPQSVHNRLNVLHAIFKLARKRKLVRANPVEDVERPKVTRRRWTILSPTEIARVAQAFIELAADERDEEQRAFLEQARVVFLLVCALGLRRGEVLGLRWRHVFLADPEGARLRVEETWTRGAIDTPKSEASTRTLAIGSRLAEELFQHRSRTRYAGDDERVFCHPFKGSALDHKRYAEALVKARAKAKVEKSMRPFHDGRHTALTNAAVAGNPPAAIQARAGHASYSTTERYVNLAGVAFRDEAQAAEDRVLGGAVPVSSETE
jgi:integrase